MTALIFNRANFQCGNYPIQQQEAGTGNMHHAMFNDKKSSHQPNFVAIRLIDQLRKPETNS
jgi:hypothetical protein